MKTYIVTSSDMKHLDLAATFTSRAARIEIMKKAYADFHSLVEKFAAEHPGQIIIQEGAWINQSLKIQAEPAIAEKLSKLPGIGEISAPRQITPDHITGKQRPPAP